MIGGARTLCEPLLTKLEAAERLNVSVRFVERCVTQRRIRFVRVGRFIRVPESAVAEFVRDATVEVGGASAMFSAALVSPHAPSKRRTR